MRERLPEFDPIETTAKAVDSLLTAMTRAPSAGAVTAYKAAIVRHGRQLVAGAGPSALDATLARIKDTASDAVSGRERMRIVSLAWEGLAA